MIIYKITNTVNGKVYIGQTVQANHQRRWRKHVTNASKEMRCRALAAAIQKYGAEAFTFCVVEQMAKDSTQADLDTAEARWISKEGSMSPGGYNLTVGGGSAGARSAETKARISQNTRRQMAGLTAEERKARMAHARKCATEADKAHRLQRLREAMADPDFAARRRAQAATLANMRWAKYRERQAQ